MYTATCDKCKTATAPTLATSSPTGWAVLRTTGYISGLNKSIGLNILLCPDCISVLGTACAPGPLALEDIMRDLVLTIIDEAK